MTTVMAVTRENENPAQADWSNHSEVELLVYQFKTNWC